MKRWDIKKRSEIDGKVPLNSPVGPPYSLPVGSIWNVLSLTPPITTSSKEPQTSSPEKPTKQGKTLNHHYTADV